MQLNEIIKMLLTGCEEISWWHRDCCSVSSIASSEFTDLVECFQQITQCGKVTICSFFFTRWRYVLKSAHQPGWILLARKFWQNKTCLKKPSCPLSPEASYSFSPTTSHICLSPFLSYFCISSRESALMAK